MMKAPAKIPKKGSNKSCEETGVEAVLQSIGAVSMGGSSSNCGTTSRGLFNALDFGPRDIRAASAHSNLFGIILYTGSLMDYICYPDGYLEVKK